MKCSTFFCKASTLYVRSDCLCALKYFRFILLVGFVLRSFSVKSEKRNFRRERRRHWNFSLRVTDHVVSWESEWASNTRVPCIKICLSPWKSCWLRRRLMNNLINQTLIERFFLKILFRGNSCCGAEASTLQTLCLSHFWDFIYLMVVWTKFCK